GLSRWGTVFFRSQWQSTGIARPDMARRHAGADLRGTRQYVNGLAHAVGQGYIERHGHARPVTWRGDRPLVGQAGQRWPLAPSFFPLQSLQSRALMQGRHASLALRWCLVVAT